MAGSSNGVSGAQQPPAIPYIDLSYDGSVPESSVLTLIYRIQPKWRDFEKDLEIVKFTEGITNTLLKVSKNTPGTSQAQIDHDSILMRAYGNNTELLIDRDREAKSHSLLAQRSMAPPLLARFENGLLYGYVPGKVCTAEDLIQEKVWRGVAKKLGEWHARVPINEISTSKSQSGVNGSVNGMKNHMNGGKDSTQSTNLAQRFPVPNVWSIMQKWVSALSTGTEKERARKNLLQRELERSFGELDNEDGLGDHGMVFGHCDLLSANVIKLPSPKATTESETCEITFIDYEYAVPCPAAFDICNHFAEWGGYDCDYTMLPSKSIRRGFLEEYVRSYGRHADVKVSDRMVESLYQEIDSYRGMPGLYWGIWALVQAKISQIDFDYASYAEVRLAEYFAWRAEIDGSRAREGKPTPLRESRWAES